MEDILKKIIFLLIFTFSFPGFAKTDCIKELEDLVRWAHIVGSQERLQEWAKIENDPHINGHRQNYEMVKEAEFKFKNEFIENCLTHEL